MTAYRPAASRWTATVAASSAAQHAGHLPGGGADVWLDVTDADLIWADPHTMNGSWRCRPSGDDVLWTWSGYVRGQQWVLSHGHGR